MTCCQMVVNYHLTLISCNKVLAAICSGHKQVVLLVFIQGHRYENNIKFKHSNYTVKMLIDNETQQWFYDY